LGARLCRVWRRLRHRGRGLAVDDRCGEADALGPAGGHVVPGRHGGHHVFTATGVTEQGMTRFASFREFYPFYLSEHANRTSRRLHFVGSCFALVFLLMALVQANAWWLLAALLCGY